MKETERTKILYVGNDEHFLRTISLQLAEADHEMVCAPNGEQAVKVLRRERVDLILLEGVLPDGDGCQLCLRIRGGEGGFTGPVILLSGAAHSMEIVRALRSGGSDYLVKSVDRGILRERIEENLRRFRSTGSKKDRRWFKQFMIDNNRREVYRVEEGRLGRQIFLSPLEYAVLEALIRHQDEVALYGELYRDVWQQEDLGDVRSLMVHVSNLRKKVDQNHTEMIVAVRGVGYLFQDA